MTTGLWAIGRQPGSFRGVPFVVLESQLRRGRQIAMHLYPFRDNPWPEDVGRSPRMTSIRGFVVGDDADAQMQALIDAVETAGPGAFVHPTLGSINAVVTEFSVGDAPTRGRMWSFEMTVVPWLVRTYPVLSADTQSGIKALFGSFGDSVAADFAAAQQAVSTVQKTVTSAVQTVQSYVAQAQSLVHDATSLVNLPGSVVGNFGRFSGANIAVGVPGFSSLALASSAVSGAFARVGSIGNTLGNLASKL